MDEGQKFLPFAPCKIQLNCNQMNFQITENVSRLSALQPLLLIWNIISYFVLNVCGSQSFDADLVNKHSWSGHMVIQ